MTMWDIRTIANLEQPATWEGAESGASTIHQTALSKAAFDALNPPAVPRVVSIDPRSPDAAIVAEAARILRSGGLVAIPTETVYGLAARALSPEAVARVFAAKGRPVHHPLIAHVLGETQARSLASSWPERASRLARAFWPGPLTLVVERERSVPAEVTGGADSIAVRAPSHPVARAVIAALGEPIAAPSANRYQDLSPTTAAHVVKELGDAVDLILDAGPCDAGIESTVVDVRGELPRVLRPGALSLVSLRRVISDVQTTAAALHGQTPRVSPGMEARHYAPRARLIVADTWLEAQRIAYGLAGAGGRVGLVTHEKPTTSVTHNRVLVRTLPADPTQYARKLYGTLHDLDDAGVDAIVVQGVPRDEAWWAVADRLRRGSAT
jgi:L-threonylcarbamoyladenylate synthase